MISVNVTDGMGGVANAIKYENQVVRLPVNRYEG
jgi:hypothetical protein